MDNKKAHLIMLYSSLMFLFFFVFLLCLLYTLLPHFSPALLYYHLYFYILYMRKTKRKYIIFCFYTREDILLLYKKMWWWLLKMSFWTQLNHDKNLHDIFVCITLPFWIFAMDLWMLQCTLAFHRSLSFPCHYISLWFGSTHPFCCVSCFIVFEHTVERVFYMENKVT